MAKGFRASKKIGYGMSVYEYLFVPIVAEL